MKTIPIWLLFPLILITAHFSAGCAGGCTKDDDAPDNLPRWGMTGPAGTPNGPPGGSAYFDFTVSNSGSIEVSIELAVTAKPSGWTVSLSEGTAHVGVGASKTVRATVDIPAGASTGTTGAITIRGRRATTDIQNMSVGVLVGSALSTGIIKVSDFAPGPDGSWVCTVRAENGSPGGLLGTFSYTFVPNIVYWYRPSDDIVLGVNQSKEYEVVAVPIDSVQAAGSNTVTMKFDKGATVYSTTSSFTQPINNNRGFRFEIVDGYISNSLIGSEARYRVFVDLPPGAAGRYTPTLDNLDNSLSYTFSPSYFDFDASGGTHQFDLIITRDVADTAQGFMPYEPVFVGTHATRAQANIRQMFPIRSHDGGG